MAIKNILVHLDHSSSCKHRLQSAIALAKQNQAALTGLFIVQQYVIPAYVEAQVSVDIISKITEDAIDRAQESMVELQQLADDAGVKMSSQVVEAPMISMLREYSKYNDLLILGQDQPDDPDNVSYGLADALLFEGACPCLVIPAENSFDAAPGKRILIAWNASRESARAIRAALPLLSAAETVVVLSSETEADDTAQDGTHPDAAALENYLKNHGISVVTSGFGDRSGAPSAVITAQAIEMKADLIVMGAYGHARLREIILGGVTRDLLKRSTIPLLLAH